MRISDWSSDVCSSDLTSRRAPGPAGARPLAAIWPTGGSRCRCPAPPRFQAGTWLLRSAPAWSLFPTTCHRDGTWLRCGSAGLLSPASHARVLVLCHAVPQDKQKTHLVLSYVQALIGQDGKGVVQGKRMQKP